MRVDSQRTTLLNLKRTNLAGLLLAVALLVYIAIFSFPSLLVPYSNDLSLKLSQTNDTQELKQLSQTVDTRLKFAHESIGYFTLMVSIFLLIVIALFGINLFFAWKLIKASAVAE